MRRIYLEHLLEVYHLVGDAHGPGHRLARLLLQGLAQAPVLLLHLEEGGRRGEEERRRGGEEEEKRGGEEEERK